MANQEKLEKVIKGFEHCIDDKCEGCPYYDEEVPDCDYEGTCHRGDLYVDALALLKAQGARVMTLEEVKSLERDAVVWYEHNGVNVQRPRIVYHVYDRGIIFTDGGHWRFNADAYGKNFRLWTSRPDEKRRAETPWQQ